MALQIPDEWLAVSIRKGAIFLCLGLKYKSPEDRDLINDKYIICLTDLDHARQRVPVAITTTQTDHGKHDHCIELINYDCFRKKTYLNLTFLQFLPFQMFKSAFENKNIFQVGELREEDLEQLKTETRVANMPTHALRREEYRAILVLLHDDIDI
ncbi:MAG: hypothetical protein WCV62_01190 [Candidatus Peribacteraceae bacterium]